MKVILDAGCMGQRETVHGYLKEKLSLPDYYGNNLDALWDCLTTMDDTEIVICNREQAQEYFDRVYRVFQKAAEENPNLRLLEEAENAPVQDEDIFLQLLGAWYQAKHRQLPWRSDPTPYHVWISEIMLQQTRVEAVKDYYKRFMERLPDVKALSEVSDDELMKLWQGLGYYSRARNLKKCAAKVMEEHGGELPADYKQLEALPGIGPYTAGAIASIAYHLPCAAVDGNVLRVMSRLAGSYEDITLAQTKKQWKAYLEQLYRKYPQVESGDINQALMELGATVCIPNGAPKCADCPLEGLCAARAKGLTQELPVRAEKKPRRDVMKTVLLIVHQGRVLLLRRPSEGLLADLYEYPNVDKHLEMEAVEDYLSGISPAWEAADLEVLGSLPDAKHIFTHLEWHMIGYAVKLECAEPGALAQDIKAHTGATTAVWADRAELETIYAVPGAFSAYTQEALKCL